MAASAARRNFRRCRSSSCFWRAWKRGGDERYRDAVDITLRRMCQGGIYDHLGGGFSRYATDAEWLIPHFEKMLYDNAALLDLLALVWQESREPLYEQRIREIVAWLLREMLTPAEAIAGRRAFASALDADSEGVEGKFYVWTEAEIDEVLGAEAPLFKQHYDVRPEGNWEEHTILNRSARPLLMDDATETALAASRAKLLARRDRPHPSGLRRQGAGGLERADDRRTGPGRRALRRAGLDRGGPHGLRLRAPGDDGGGPASP